MYRVPSTWREIWRGQKVVLFTVLSFKCLVLPVRDSYLKKQPKLIVVQMCNLKLMLLEHQTRYSVMSITQSNANIETNVF